MTDIFQSTPLSNHTFRSPALRFCSLTLLGYDRGSCLGTIPKTGSHCSTSSQSYAIGRHLQVGVTPSDLRTEDMVVTPFFH